MSNHALYIKKCIELALKGRGNVVSNPLVGAVLVYNNEVIGTGFHEKFGGPHAEVNCIQSVAADKKYLIPESTLYISLEPCNHEGKTPPCTQLIVKSGIKKVVFGAHDINTNVTGGGAKFLQQHGIQVQGGILENECKEINKSYFYAHEHKRPYVILKWACTKDGFIAYENKARLKISNQEVDHTMHFLRSQVNAILVGYNTVVEDDPSLTVRHVQGQNPVRIVWDAKLSLQKGKYKIFQSEEPLIILNNSKQATEGNITYLKADSLEQFLESLYEMNILSVLVEGGKKTIEAFLAKSQWNQVIVIQSNVELMSGYPAPVFNEVGHYRTEIFGNNVVRYYTQD